MKGSPVRLRAELLPVALLLALGGLVAWEGIRGTSTRRRARERAIARDTLLTEADVAMGVTRRATAPASQGQSVTPAELRRRVSALARGSYVDDILGEQDSALYRWPERLGDAVRVFIEPTSSEPGFDPRYPETARTVFAEWSEAGFPVRFVFVYDSSGADISIRWRDHFPASEGQRIGITERVQTSRFLIARAAVSVALHDSTGRVLTATTVSGIVRHEVGHALGLNHANDPTSVMYYESATSMISASDRATLRLLYLVPPGSLR